MLPGATAELRARGDVLHAGRGGGAGPPSGQPELGRDRAGDGDDAIILEGTAIIVTDPAEWTQVNNAYMEKYVDPHSGAKATLVEADNLYRVDLKRIMCWEYGVVATRTDWKPDSPGRRRSK